MEKTFNLQLLLKVFFINNFILDFDEETVLNKNHLAAHKNSVEFTFLNGVKDNIYEYVEDFETIIERDTPVNEGTIVDFKNKDKR